MDIANFIKEKRIKIGLTQEQLASGIGVLNTTISNYEQGVSAPNLETFLRIAEILKCNTSSLTDEKFHIYEKIYKNISALTTQIPVDMLDVISIDEKWQCDCFSNTAGYLLTENISSPPKNKSLVVASFDETGERIFETQIFKGMLYLIPKTYNRCLIPLRADINNISMKRIISIIQFPNIANLLK